MKVEEPILAYQDSHYENLYSKMEISLSDYKIEDASTITLEYMTRLKNEGNYKNFTIEKINEMFSKKDIQLKEIFKEFGKPEIVWIEKRL